MVQVQPGAPIRRRCQMRGTEKSRRHLLLVWVLGLLVPTATVHAQDPPIEWGKISMDDLMMTSYRADTSAQALILADYGQSQFNNDVGVDFERHLRVKIFSEAAYGEWGSHGLSLWTGDDEEQLDNVEGVTYSLGPLGEVVKTQLNDDAIFKEKVDENRTRYRFTLPALKPGCVVDIRYRVKQKRAFQMHTWTFQHDVPILWSEYRIRYPQRMSYAVVSISLEPFYVNESTDINLRFSGESASFLGSLGGFERCRQNRWIMRNMPALLDEPFITTMDDYIPQIHVQLAEFAPRSGGLVHVMKTWEQLISELLDDKDFGGRLDPSGEVGKLAENLAARCSTGKEKVAALFDYVRLSIVAEKGNGFWGYSNPEDVLRTRKGSAADANFLLMAMLLSLGIETHPVLLSTRANGRITDIYPILRQFNYVIAQAVVDGQPLYLDASDPARPIDLLPTKVLNVRGLLVKPKTVEWVNITTAGRSEHRAIADIFLSASGDIRGTIESVDEEYSALQMRHGLKEISPDEFARISFDAEKTGLALDSVTVAGRDSIAGPLRISAHVASSTYAQAQGDFLYVNPIPVDRLRTNPLTRRERNFPVDMMYVCMSTTASKIHVPEGFEVEDLPPPLHVRVGPSDAVYSLIITKENDAIVTLARLSISKTQFPPQQYAELKAFYDQVVASSNALVVLKRAASPPAGSKQQNRTLKAGKGGKK